MDLGRELIAAVFRDRKALKRFIEEGFDLGWMTDREDLSRAAIFGETDIEAYKFLLRAWEREREVPSRSYFEHSFPPESFRLPESDLTVAELVAMASEDRQRVQLEVKGSEFIDLFDAGKYAEAAALMEETGRKVRQSRTRSGVYLTWDSADYDLEAKLSREEVPGVRTGVPTIDDAFPGFQPKQLITYLGRAKAMKTAWAIFSALAAHDDGWNVLVVSVEIDAHAIADRLDCYAAGVDHLAYTRGRLSDQEKTKLRASQSKRGREGYLTVVQPIHAYTVTDLDSDIERYRPHAVYVDGFYFLTDRISGKPGANWEGHDNLARELKELAMRRNVMILTTMQIREKQARGGKSGGGFDDNSMMGGTGLIMASDMVLTLDMDNESKVNTIACSRSRTAYLPTVRGIWKWKYCQFDEIPADYGEDEEAEETRF